MNDFTDIYWDESESQNKDISIIKYLDENADLIKEKYNKFIHQLSKKKINGVNVSNYFNLNKGYNLWWMSLVVEKSIYKSKSHSSCLKLITLEQIINRYKLKKINFFCDDIAIIKTVKRLSKELNIELIIINKKNSMIYNYKPPLIVKVILYSLGFFFYRWPLRQIKKKDIKKFNNKLIFFSYLYESNYQKNYINLDHLSALDKILKAKEIKTYWLHHFVSSYYRQGPITTKNILNNTNKSSSHNYHETFDTSLSISMVFKIIRTYFHIYFKTYNTKKFINLFKPNESKLLLWDVMEKDFNESFFGIICFKNIKWIYQIDQILSNIPRQKVGIYLMENQGWERALLHSWNLYGHGKIVAYQYGLLRYWDLRYCNYPSIENKKTDLPQPDAIAVSSKHAFNSFKRMGYNENVLLSVENLRYNDFPNDNSSKNKPVRKGQKVMEIIILFDIELSINRKLINYINNLSKKFDHIRIKIKFHPAGKFSVSKYLKRKFEIVADNLEYTTNNVDLALAVSNTGASVDMYLLNIPLIIFRDVSSINFSPFVKYSDEIKYITNTKELENALDSIEDYNVKNDEFLWTDKNLNKWTKVLNKLI